MRIESTARTDTIIARSAWGKYIRINPNEADNVENVTRKRRNSPRWESRSGVKTIPERIARKTWKETTRVAITQDFVENAISPTRGQIIYRDSKLIGFGLRVTMGSKSFIVEAKVNGKTRRITIGRADVFEVKEARIEALQLLRLMKSGIEPHSS